MLINLRVKTLDAQTHDFNIDNELTIREFKDKIAEKTNIAADQQRIIYCGRVLADEKQLKEYDVDGKVVHVAERPPPSQRGPSTSNSTSNDTPTPRDRSNNRGGMRNSPLFRALDGMVLGTMAIPVNAAQNNGQQQPNPFAASSSFSMNRITVARHMLDCANNIAAYLEDPERGLNNTSLDILARGSWTMESTVVEVGITATDLPQNQNIVEMVQDAVSAALRRNSNTNVTVVQLPTVFGSNEAEAEAAAVNRALTAAASAANMDANDSSSSNADTDAAAVIIEDVIDDTYDSVGGNMSISSDISADATQNTTSSPNVTTPDTSAATDTSYTSTTTGTNTDDNSSRRRTNTRVLAEVVEQMRTVQTRLNPFIQQFYELLNNDPTFDEENTTERENAQRLYNRVSEALHYMSHAQHAISDLMLDISQPAPRFLTCRPILVEQSGYVSSNNYLSAAAAAAAAAARGNRDVANGPQMRPRSRAFIAPRYIQSQFNRNNAAAAAASSSSSSSSIPVFDLAPVAVVGDAAAAAGGANDGGAAANNGNNNSSTNSSGSGASFEDPVDEPLTAPGLPLVPAAAMAAAAAGGTRNADTQSNDNPQVQMSRLIQAMVNSAPINTELHVQILPPTIVSVPVNARVGNRAQAGGSAAAPASASAPATNSNSSNNGSAANSANNNADAATAVAASTNNTNNITDNNEQQRNASNSNNSSNNATPTTAARAAGAAAATHHHHHRPVSASLAIGTLPTTSTQTRSTSRPQLQIGGLPANGWNGRFIPANMMSSFDRFLPCNSHHIREPENGNGNGNNGTPTANAAGAGANTNTQNAMPQIITSNVFNPRSLRTLADFLPRVRSTPTVAGSSGSGNDSAGGSTNGPSSSSSSATTSRSNATRTPPAPPRMTAADFIAARNALGEWQPLTTPNASSTASASASNAATQQQQKQQTPTTAKLDQKSSTSQSKSTGTSSTETTAAAPAPPPAADTDTSGRNLRTQLLQFISQRLFAGEPINEQTVPPAVNRAVDWFDESLVLLPQYEKPEYDSRHSVVNILREMLPVFIEIVRDEQTNPTAFEQRIKQICEEFVKRLYSVLFVCVGRTNADMYWAQLMRLLWVPTRSYFQDEALRFLSIYINTVIPTTTDTADAQQFIVQRIIPTADLSSTTPPPLFDDENDDVEMVEVASTSTKSTPIKPPDGQFIIDLDHDYMEVEAALPAEQLPSVTAGTEPWHRNFPNDWLPLITHDLCIQSANPPNQAPLSDAYISGMSAKRRKMLQNAKPPTDVNALIARSVHKAIQSLGPPPPPRASTSSAAATNFDPAAAQRVTEAIVNDAAVQASFKEAVRTNVRERLKKETSDYKADKYPHATKFINNNK